MDLRIITVEKQQLMCVAFFRAQWRLNVYINLSARSKVARVTGLVYAESLLFFTLRWKEVLNSSAPMLFVQVYLYEVIVFYITLKLIISSY